MYMPAKVRLEKNDFVRCKRMSFQRVFTVALFVVMLTACSPVGNMATQTDVTAIRTETPLASFTPGISTSTVTSTVTAEIYSTFTPAPTYTAIPALRPGQALTLTSIHMGDKQNGWGIDAGEHIVHTADGGYTWRDVTPRSGGYRVSGFFALDADTAWATSYQWYGPIEPNNASIWHTSDGGNSWQEQHLCLQDQDCGSYFDVRSVYYWPIALQFSDAQSGWLLVSVEHLMFQDRYRIYQTTDGGAHWIFVRDSGHEPWVNSVTGLAFQDQQTGWFATSQIDGATDPSADWSIYQSTDAGRTWNQFQLPVPDPLPETFAGNQAWCGADGVSVIPPDTVGVTIECKVYTKPMSSYDFYFHSSDGGKLWNSWLKTGDVEFINSLVGWRSVFNDNAFDLEQTRDGGQTWTKLKTVQWNGDLDFVSEQTGWAIATNDNTAALVHTTDGGKTWQELKPVVTGK